MTGRAPFWKCLTAVPTANTARRYKLSYRWPNPFLWFVKIFLRVFPFLDLRSTNMPYQEENEYLIWIMQSPKWECMVCTRILCVWRPRTHVNTLYSWYTQFNLFYLKLNFVNKSAIGNWLLQSIILFYFSHIIDSFSAPNCLIGFRIWMAAMTVALMFILGVC